MNGHLYVCDKRDICPIAKDPVQWRRHDDCKHIDPHNKRHSCSIENGWKCDQMNGQLVFCAPVADNYWDPDKEAANVEASM